MTHYFFALTAAQVSAERFSNLATLQVLKSSQLIALLALPDADNRQAVSSCG